uniref:Ubiquitin-like protease family profile domain-containing protein n=2 Tax=Brassica oleracea TaxID=3712 RepID=A0A0D3DLA4_BRAOL|nr:unnamed protein product [Brassica oleracea]
MGPIPNMMFATGEEPVGVRLLTYQSSNALKRIFNALDEEEVDIIRRSSFGKLIDIEDKPIFSGIFARYLLSRQLKTKKKHEIWFRFAGKPVRFSLREFAIVTGLPCGKYPRKSKMKLKKTISEKPYWPSLFGKVEVVTVSSVIKMLYHKTVKDKEIRIKYACLALLESVLLPTSLKMKIAREHQDEVALSQNTIAVKGFALALLLVMVEAVPSLTEVVQEICSSSESDSDEIDGNGRDIFTKKKTLNPAHARNVDKRCIAHVNSLLNEDSTRSIDEANLGWSDEEQDSKVENLVACINANHQFTTSLFRGVVRQTDVERMRESCKSTCKSRKATYVHSHGQNIEPGNIVGLVMEKIKPQLAYMEDKINLSCARVDGMEGKVVVQVKDMFVKFKEEMIISVTEKVRAMFKDEGSVHRRPSHIPTAAPIEVPGPATVIASVDDANAITIGNDENLTPSKKDPVAPGFVCGSPEAETCAQSANSQNRGRQNVFHESLEGNKRQRENPTGEPSFSLCLTQEEQNQGEEHIFVPDVPERECISLTKVDDNIEEGQVSRKSKRHKTVPSGLVDDYQCGRHIMSRVREAQKYIFVIDDQSDMTRKYAQLSVKLREKFVVNVAGLAVYAKDIQLILERPRLLSTKVMDILIRVSCLAVCPNLPPEGSRSAAFLDTKFVISINKTYPKFLKSRNKEAYMFPKGLRDIFPSKDDPKVHQIRYYFPFNVGTKHWVVICFDARTGVLTVLDCNATLYKDSSVEKYIKSILQMLPYLARYVGETVGAEPVIQCYDVARPKSVAHNKNPADSGLMAMLLMATHAIYGIEACKSISHEVLEEEGRRAAIWRMSFKEQL